MDLPAYRRLRQRARAHARVPDEAEDLLQSALLAAAEAGRLDDAAWIEGTLRRMAALDARTAIRRRRREALAADGHEEDVAASDGAAMSPGATAGAAAPVAAGALLATLPPSARRVAVLALHGLDAGEIQWILGIAPTAFRQRLTRIRQALAALPAPQRDQALAATRERSRSLDLQFGLVRRALKAALVAGEGLGTHDVDGHLLVISRRRAHTRAPGGNA